MRRVAHLSDLHFGAHVDEVVAQVADDVRRQRVDVVAVSGDLTQRARRRQFEAARAFLDGLGAPWIAVPGNHDLAADPVRRFLAPRRGYARAVDAHASTTHAAYVDEELAILGLDSTWRWVWKGGRLGASAARIVARWGEDHPRRARIVVSHHPFGVVAEPAGHEPVRGARTMLEAMACNGIEMVLTGHDHIGTAHRLRGRHEPLVVVQAATACSRRMRGRPNGYNLITVDDRVLRVEPRDLVEGRFQAALAQEFPRRTALSRRALPAPCVG